MVGWYQVSIFGLFALLEVNSHTSEGRKRNEEGYCWFDVHKTTSNKHDNFTTHTRFDMRWYIDSESISILFDDYELFINKIAHVYKWVWVQV